MDIKHKFKLTLAGFALVFYVAMPAIAEDIEIYTSGALGASTVQPNVMFIVDTSGSMSNTIDIQVDYDYTTTYGGPRNSSQIYYTRGGTVGSINTNRDRFNKTANKCDASLQLYDNGVVIDPIGPLLRDGFYGDQIAQFRNNRWRTPNTRNNSRRNLSIECKADSGIHGDTSSTNPYIANTVGWTSNVPADLNNPHPIWDLGANQYTLYDGNYLNYLQSGGAIQSVSRMQIAKDAVKAIVDTNNSINVCLMRFDGAWNFEGGPVIYPCEDVKTSRDAFNTQLGNLNAGGSTPLSETMYEALLYFGGKSVDYGDGTNPGNQPGTQENSTFYQTPITDTCQKNYIVYLTDGAPQLDYLSTARRTSPLTNFPVGSCNTDADPGLGDLNLSSYNKDAFSSDTSTRDNCLDELAAWAFNNDVATKNIPAHDDDQNIVTYTIGFDFAGGDPDLQAAEQLLRDTAAAGDGSFFEAISKESLLNAFNQIVAEILAVNSTFSSPAVSVNAFNRATNLDDLYFTLFKPDDGEHWIGNFKKFKLAFDATTGDPFIADQTGNPAIDPASGFFFATSRSFWTTGSDDGAETAVGGAASRQTNTRNVYTTTGVYSNSNGVMTLTGAAADLTSNANALDKTNTALTETLLDIVGNLPLIGTTPYIETLIDWASGIDVLDEDNIGGTSGSVTDARRVMGDPLHAEPGLVQYGSIGPDADGDGVPDIPDIVAYVATNDGYLHAIDTIDGSENFSFVPLEMLPKLDNIFQNTGVNGKQYGLDGNVIPWINDVGDNPGDPGDGFLDDAGDFAYLYFGMRRGGRDIYSIDVTNRDFPELRWKIEGGVGDYAELGETWSTVNVEEILIGTIPTTVLIFGGGYDTAQDTVGVRTPDAVGRGVFIVDATTGALLWRAGPDAAADLTHTAMQYSIPARIKPLDIDGDGYIDRLYTGDMGGQIWRFDIDNTANTTSSLSVDGGVFADIAVDGNIADTRRFYYPPDVALIVQEGQPPFLSVVAVSGYRAHPLDIDIQDRLYMIRDYDVYTSPNFTSYTPIVEADLFDTTDNVIGDTTNPTASAAALASLTSAAGWYISLEESDGSFVGEKGLSEPLILGGVAVITTYIPASAGLNVTACEANDGSGRLYFVSVTDGKPRYDISGSVDPVRSVDLKKGGIPPAPSVIITQQATPTLCVGTECSRAGVINAAEKMYWYEK